jgi:hypothetical protein
MQNDRQFAAYLTEYLSPDDPLQNDPEFVAAKKKEISGLVRGTWVAVLRSEMPPNAIVLRASPPITMFSFQIPTLKIWSLGGKFSPPVTIPKLWRVYFDQRLGLEAFLDQKLIFGHVIISKAFLIKTFSTPLALQQARLLVTELQDCSISTALHLLYMMASQPDASSAPGSPAPTSRSRGKGKVLAWSDI